MYGADATVRPAETFNVVFAVESVDQVLLHVQTFIQVDRREKLYFEQKYCGRVFERFEPFS